MLLLGGVVCAQGGEEYAAGLEAYRRGDFAEALTHWRPLAEAGSREAQFNLGLIYEKGLGLEADPQQAVGWYRRSAEANFAQAQYKLASIYETGRGVPEDPVVAYAWYSAAGAQKYADSRKRKKKVAKRLTPHDLAQAELMVREWLRARRDGELETTPPAHTRPQ